MFDKTKIKKILLEGIHLVVPKDTEDIDSCVWVNFQELKIYYQNGFILFNSQKRDYFQKNCLN